MGLSLWAARAWSVGDLDATVWENGFGPGWSWPEWRWTPFIHSPVWNHFMAAVQALADALRRSPAAVVWGMSAVCAAISSATAAAHSKTPWSAAIAVGAAASTLRPFEEYPLARLAVLLAWVAVVRLDGRARLSVVLVLWVTTMLHLSAWFLLGPAVLAYVLLRGDRRLGALLGVTLGVFVLTLFPSIVDVFATGAGRDGWSAPALHDVSTVEWTMPLWFAAALAALAPAVARRAPEAAALAFGVLVFTGAHFALMAAGFAIGGSFDAPGFPPSAEHHHYFELVEPLLVLAALDVLADRPRLRATLVAAQLGWVAWAAGTLGGLL